MEGIIARAISGLQQDQETRRQEHPDDAATIDEFVTRLQALKTVSTPWTLELEDISGELIYRYSLIGTVKKRCVKW